VIFAGGYTNGEIAWEDVEIRPGEQPVLPSSKGASHYYAARETDAAPLRAGGEWEKLIFYRGVGNLEVPLRPTFGADGRIVIRNAGSEPIPAAIVFENREGKVGYRLVRQVEASVAVEPPELNASVDRLHEDLADLLVEAGLYGREAHAMIATWRDSWFEEGMRVFYLIPRTSVDEALPLTIEPAPSKLERVFVGRVEMLSPSMRRMIESGTDSNALVKLGRFLNVFAPQVMRRPGTYSPALREAIGKVANQNAAGGCVE
jgi:hypothetical protein